MTYSIVPFGNYFMYNSKLYFKGQLGVDRALEMQTGRVIHFELTDLVLRVSEVHITYKI